VVQFSPVMSDTIEAKPWYGLEHAIPDEWERTHIGPEAHRGLHWENEVYL